MKRVILDTNFLLIPGSLGVHIFSELERVAPGYTLFIVDKTMDELRRLREKSALIALQLIEKEKIGLIQTSREGIVDDLIVENAVPGQDMVATQDKELKERLKAKGVDLVVLRKKKYLNAIKT